MALTWRSHDGQFNFQFVQCYLNKYKKGLKKGLKKGDKEVVEIASVQMTKKTIECLITIPWRAEI
jgi:hypothetical protein